MGINLVNAATKQTAVVSKDELLELAEWEKKYSDAKKKATEAEKELKFRRLQLAEKVLGVKSESDLKELSPGDVIKRMTRRLTAGDWKRAQNAPDFQFVKTSEGRYPSWSQLYIDELGETAAARVRAETPVTYSYAVEVSLA